jgi:alginate O-acetyltransferase complex protein AlgI
MWFLQMDTLLLMLGMSLLMGLGLRAAGERQRRRAVLRWMPLLDIALLWYVSEKLTVFYLGYTAVTYGFLAFLRRRKRGRGVWFALLCLGCCVPLVYSRLALRWPLPTYGLTMIGIAYNMLKAIDALYYEYYGGERVPLERYVNYMLLFPVLTAGPVFRYREFDRTWDDPAPLDGERLSSGVRRIIRGLFKKVVLAMAATKVLWRLVGLIPRLGLLAPAVPLASLAVLFWDMSGYADIAIGMGHLMGLAVPENFKKPFSAPSFTQFWRNWHVTVSDWIREHVYVLLGGRRLGRGGAAAVAFGVMVLMGLWHGFTWLYLIDGVLLGLILALENLLNLTTVNRRKAKKWVFVLRCALTVYLFALNSMVFTLPIREIRLVLGGFFAFMGGGL